MRIDSIELFHVAMPLIYPWRTAYGEDAACHSVLCRMTSGSVAAWGESSPLAAPCYSPEWAGGLFAVARQWLAPALVGRDINSGEELQQHLAVYKGNPFARGLLDMAWWNLESRIRGLPLHRLLGATRDRVAVGADFGVMDSFDDLLGAVGQAVEKRISPDQVEVSPRLGRRHAARGPRPASARDDSHRLQQRLSAGRPAHVSPDRRISPGDDRAASRARRPRRPRAVAGRKSTRRSASTKACRIRGTPSRPSPSNRAGT